MHWTHNPAYISISILGEAQRNLTKMKNKHTIVEKTWGSEVWFANNEMYCGKLLTIEYDKWSSKGKYHYHEVKDETFFVVEGILWLDIADDETGEYQRYTLYENDSYRVMPGVKHRFSSAKGTPCKFIEASTTHREDDSYRCYYDKKREDWIHV